MGKTTPTRRPELWQLYVEKACDGKLLAVGPAVLKPAAEMFCATVLEQIRLGREKAWANPHVVQVLTFH